MIVCFVYCSSFLSLSRSFLAKGIPTALKRPRYLHTSLLAREMKSLVAFANDADNTFTTRLVQETPPEDATQFDPRQVRGAHFTLVTPEPCPQPHLVIASTSCAEELGLDPKEVQVDAFAQLFSGTTLLPGFDRPWASVYGCHCYGHWFGQLGDGRAMSIGEVITPGVVRKELQLKGCGRTPYSRGFDGRAVLRSSVREFLVSEAMYHLRVPTARALCIVTTGLEVRRPWYAATTATMKDGSAAQYSARGGKFSPDTLRREPGAVMCRVSESFLRFSHLELFGMRDEVVLLTQMADYVCFREFPHILEITSLPERYIALYREVASRASVLVVEWLRVGYVQGNMNSDNTLLGGRTIDYGPYGWMERFDPQYQPFTSDQEGKFAFIRQPQAMAVNVAVLGETFEKLVRYVSSKAGCIDEDTEKHITEVREIAKVEFQQMFFERYQKMQQQKLGLSEGSGADSTVSLYRDLEQLMSISKCDFTIMYRSLADAADSETPSDALKALSPAFEDFNSLFSAKDSTTGTDSPESDKWIAWLSRYLARIKSDGKERTERLREQNLANPKFVLRNWMAVLAYEAAEKGDYSVLHELETLLRSPYDEQTVELSRKWYIRTPDYAVNMPGVKFMS